MNNPQQSPLDARNEELEKELALKNRELEVEAALERVRARAMAMYNSDELNDVLAVLIEQFDILGIHPVKAVLCLFDEEKNTFTFRTTGRAGQRIIGEQIFAIDSNDVFKEIFETWKNSAPHSVFCNYISSKDLPQVWNLFPNTFANMPEEASVYPKDYPDGLYNIFGYCKFGFIGFDHTRAATESEKKIVVRFANEFERLYQRFLDLQKAEAQAREAQIETALERVRSRSMGMHKSEELREVIQLVFEQLLHLNIKADAAMFDLDFRESNDFNLWVAVPGSSYPRMQHIPYFDQLVFNTIRDAKASGLDFCVEQYSLEEKNQFFEHFFQHVTFVPEERKNFIFSSPGMSRSTLLLKSIGLSMLNYEGIPYTEAENDIFKRLGNVFEQSYTRFLDLQKAEAQVREAKIEAALERVRARTMAMQRSDELADVAEILFKQVQNLGIHAWSAGFNIWHEGNDAYTDWVTNPSGGFMEPYTVDLTSHPFFREVSDAKKRGENFHVFEISGEPLAECYALLTSFAPKQFEGIIASGFQLPPRQINHYVFGAQVGLMFITPEPNPEAYDIFKRFGKVFEQTYTRFLDLQKAEAQARESQIQLALERVRARTMAMQKSDELQDTAALLFQQVNSLGVVPWACGFNIYDNDRKAATSWMASEFGKGISSSFKVPVNEHIFKDIFQAAQSGESLYIYEINSDKIQAHYKYMYTIPVAGDRLKGFVASGGVLPTTQILHSAFFSHGYLLFITQEPVPETWNVFIRFAKVFEQTYTRFLDLQKAEAQAREARIENALEKVRSRSLAMHKSDELQEVVNTVFERLKDLEIETDTSSISVHNSDDTNSYMQWAQNAERTYSTCIRTPYYEQNNFGLAIVDALKNKKELVTGTYTKEEKNEWFNYMFTHSDFKHIPDSRKEFILSAESASASTAATKNAGITLLRYSDKQFSKDENEILKRFARVFEQAYTRFLDLQKAEAQTREATIENALEKVRSRSLAMHKSVELQEVVNTVFGRLHELEIETGSANIVLFTERSKEVEIWSATSDLAYSTSIHLKPFNDTVISKDFFRALDNRTDLFARTYTLKEKNEYFEYLFEHTDFKHLNENRKHFILGAKSLTSSIACTKNACIFLMRYVEKTFSEKENEILKRFARVFEQAYIRFLDLQKAEEQAKEAIKASSLDRVRGEIASMRNADDLNRITPLVWRELIALGVPFFRCGVMIVDEKEEKVQFYLSTPEGKPLAALNLEFNNSAIIKNGVDYWRKQKVYTEHWDKEQFVNFTKGLIEQGQIQTTTTYQGGEEPPESLTLQFVPFVQGMMYVGSAEALTQTQIELVQALAETFAVAYARYEDFKKIENAKSQIEKTLNELKDTQKQLIQAEKMASLGELTAGIAHEIQNPLNFVNNFSEVNAELLEELKAERSKPKAERNEETENELINDVIDNEQKINHHGKRADAIVKGMLQHSQSSTGVKLPTNINTLADEYFRLSYHGLRAKDKLFNATLQTNFDESIGLIKIIPQDIGRVILNLFNNAFYAVNEKKQKNTEGYEPIVSVSTKKIGDKVEIKVADNGNGIPQKIADKIFQPFFTTKPTGQGTGLGLSLSYDIIKAHGGEIKVETKEGEGTSFIIQLPIV